MASFSFSLSVFYDISEEYSDFVHIWYSCQVPCVAHACKIVFVTVPNLSNHGHFLKHFVYLLQYLRKECVDFIHI